MAKAASTQKQNEPVSEELDAKPTCGLIMPISAMPPEYDERHWIDVRQVLEQAIHTADMRPQIVSDSFESDVIQRRIIHNLYENPVVVCDVSGLNPNVMFELGMRVTFKRPVIIVTDNEKRIPFDTSVIEYLPYPVSLHIHDTNNFVDRLSDRIRLLYDQYQKNSYTSFIEAFGKFEVLSPSTEAVEPSKYFASRFDELTQAIRRMERNFIGNDFIRPQGVLSGMIGKNALSIDDALGRTSVRIYRYMIGGSTIAADSVISKLNNLKGVTSADVIRTSSATIVTVSVEPLAHSSTEDRINEIIGAAGGSRIS